MASTVYRNIEAERVRAGISKEELARLIGVSLKTYYNWIKGENPIPSTALIKMADIFNVEIDYLLGRNLTLKPRVPEETA